MNGANNAIKSAASQEALCPGCVTEHEAHLSFFATITVSFEGIQIYRPRGGEERADPELPTM